MTLTEHEILREAAAWRDAGRQVAVCTVIETWGAAPRPVGSHLVVDGDGVFIGSVSGGCVEGDVIAEAIDVTSSGRSRVLEFGVSDELAWTAKLTCGGRIKVYVERLDDGLASCIRRMIDDYTVSKPTVLVATLDGATRRVVRRDAHARDVVHARDGLHVRDLLAAQVDEAFETGKSRLVDPDGPFLTALVPPTRLLVFGAVQIAQALLPIARHAGLMATIIDPRSAFATPERFPGVRIVAAWPNEAAVEVGMNASDAVAVLSHDPKIDDQALRVALDAGCFYVGALGSRRSNAQRLDRLRAAGVTEDKIQRIRAPIGLDIGAEGPTEIAVAILAEIISVRRRRTQHVPAEAA